MGVMSLRAKVLTLLAAGLAASGGLTACGHSMRSASRVPDAAPATIAPSALPGSLALTDAANFELVGLSFRHPATWRPYQFDEASSFTILITFLSTSPLSDPCIRTATAVTCGPPHVPLGANGVLVTITDGSGPHAAGVPDAHLSSVPGVFTTIGGHPARVETSASDVQCASTGAVSAIRAVVARATPPSQGDLLTFNACLAGPNPARAAATFRAMLDTVLLPPQVH